MVTKTKGKYILLDNGEVQEVFDLEQWAKWIETNKTKTLIKQTDTKNGKVSTVFLGLDYSLGEKKPKIFETMIFGGEEDGETERYSTKEQAVIGHDEIVKRLNK